ncbi:putative HTH-type transcriptional regulator YybR [Methanosarcinaceae archaeon Ag5]|uniref:HTH-type transcriptional regulator YybR n=1 Tax=Methanolapillus africanus TaxID=3028297 RepID=A0AAE4SEI5_9EURY|nr:putative HTH-type transcriptional regulator YybR [Methanosarcinaceae archaeon Ag5]
MLTKKELTPCPVATTVDLIGNKWKLLILRDLLSGTKRFGELRKGVDGISQKVLTDNLRSLEEDGLITRTVYAEVPPRVEYELTELGGSLQPIMKMMEEWGNFYKESMKIEAGEC